MLLQKFGPAGPEVDLAVDFIETSHPMHNPMPSGSPPWPTADYPCLAISCMPTARELDSNSWTKKNQLLHQDLEQELASINGRGERIRTSGLYVPNVALYQAKLHPEIWLSSGSSFLIVRAS